MLYYNIYYDKLLKCSLFLDECYFTLVLFSFFTLVTYFTYFLLKLNCFSNNLTVIDNVYTIYYGTIIVRL